MAAQRPPGLARGWERGRGRAAAGPKRMPSDALAAAPAPLPHSCCSSAPSIPAQRWRCSFQASLLSLGGDLWRKMHNMFYLPCGSHKIFTSSSHYSQSESRRALEPALPGEPPPCTDPASPGTAAGAAVVAVPGPDERPGPRGARGDAEGPSLPPGRPPPGLGRWREDGLGRPCRGGAQRWDGKCQSSAGPGAAVSVERTGLPSGRWAGSVGGQCALCSFPGALCPTKHDLVSPALNIS